MMNALDEPVPTSALRPRADDVHDSQATTVRFGPSAPDGPRRCAGEPTSVRASADRPRDGSALLGTLLDGRYRLEAVLGAGGMGIVYRATHEQSGRTVAVKTLRHEAAGGVEEARFRMEARLIARLRHPNIVTGYDSGTTRSGITFLVMEYLRGRTLVAELAHRGWLDVAKAAAILAQVCAAVDAAHRGGVIHRDLKPGNIFLEDGDDGRPRAKVLDFGIATLRTTAEATISRLTGVGIRLGTPNYMAPEQCRAESVSEATDVYALGCVLFALVTGKPPFAGGSSVEICERHLSALPTPPSRLRREIPHWLDAVVLKALAKSPSERFASAGELACALASNLEPATGSAGSAPRRADMVPDAPWLARA